MFLPQANAEVLCLDPAPQTGHLGACWVLLYFVLPSTKAETSRQVLMSLPEAPRETGSVGLIVSVGIPSVSGLMGTVALSPSHAQSHSCTVGGMRPAPQGRK